MPDAPPQPHRRLILRVAPSPSSTSSSSSSSSSTSSDPTTDTSPACTSTAASAAPGPKFAVGASVYRLSAGANVTIKQWRVAELMPPQPDDTGPAYRLRDEEEGDDQTERKFAKENELYHPPAAGIGDPIWIQPFGVRLTVTGISLERHLGPGFRYTCAVEEGKVSIQDAWLDWE